jgi:hypothetical protein
VRWPIGPTLHFDAGYRLTIQRLHIVDIPTLGDALEVVTVHALEAGIRWHRTQLDGSRLMFDVIAGLNRGSADNDRIEGENFSASGISLSTQIQKRWSSGFSIQGAWSWRNEGGSGVSDVTVDGMPTQAVWPSNSTWTLLALAGYTM